MTVIIRILWLALMARLRGRVRVDERSSVRLRAWPHEAGLAIMHNHVFLQMFEVGRWDLLLRAGNAFTALRNGWVPVIAAQSIRYRRPVRRFDQFDVHTQLVHWDERDLFAEHSLERNGEVLARGVVRLRFPRGIGTKSPAEVVRKLWGVEPPAAPAWLAAWKAADELHVEQRTTDVASSGAATEKVDG